MTTRATKISALSLAAILLSTPAVAKLTFAAYDGPNQIVTGRGGAKIVKNGIEWWTDGEPPRSFRIIGILTDTRENPRAIGNANIAAKVRSLGGNAVIVTRQSSRLVSGPSYVQQGQGYAAGTADVITSVTRKTSTGLIVVNYQE